MIKYKNDKQKKFIKECIRRAGNDDVWHVSLFYTLGLTNDCQNNIDSLYDFNTGCVKQIKGEKYGWITGTDIRIIRLAYNLYNNGAPTAYEIEDALLKQKKSCFLNWKQLFFTQYITVIYKKIEFNT